MLKRDNLPDEVIVPVVEAPGTDLVHALDSVAVHDVAAVMVDADADEMDDHDRRVWHQVAKILTVLSTIRGENRLEIHPLIPMNEELT